MTNSKSKYRAQTELLVMRREREYGTNGNNGTGGKNSKRNFSLFRYSRSFRILLPIALIATNACMLKAGKPNLPAIFPGPVVAKQTGKPPIIFIPGITGSELVDRTTGKKLWPDLFPEDKQVLALPITSTTLSENRDEVVASRVIESAQ